MEETNKQTQTVILTENITRDEIKQLLLNRRPGLGPVSLKSYVASLYNINRVDKKTDKQKYDLNLDNTDEVIQIINSKQRKSVTGLYSALDAITGIKIYRDLQNAETNKNHLLQIKQIKSSNCESNWVDISVLKDIYDEVTEDKWKIVEKFFKNKMPEKLKTKKFEEIKRFIAFICCSGVFIPPRRNLDWTKMLWNTPNKQQKTCYNYVDLEKKQFIFNIYKGSIELGGSKKPYALDIPEQLVIWLKHYKTIKKNDIFLPTKIYYEHYTSDAFTKHLQNFFSYDLAENHQAYGKKISTKMFRQIYDTWFYRNAPKLEDMTKLANDMGHSVNTAFHYYIKQAGLESFIKNKELIDSDNEDEDDEEKPEPDTLD